MPKKRNKAMQLQNYVPKGNGDASGEYADEETGSNIHFTNFKKPDEPTSMEKLEKFAEGKLVEQAMQESKAKKDVFEDLDKDLMSDSDFDDLEKDLDDSSFDVHDYDDLDELDDLEDLTEEDIPTIEELIDEDLSEDETKSSILNLSPDLDKNKVYSLNDKEAEKLLKAIETTENAKKDYDKLKKKETKYEGIWLTSTTASELVETKGIDGAKISIESKKAYFAEKGDEEKLSLLSKAEAEVNKYAEKKAKLDKKVAKAQKLIDKYENPNNIYSKQHKDKAVWCKSMAESKKVFSDIKNKGCSLAQIKALEGYTGSFSSINEPLRGITYGNSNSKKLQFVKQVKDMTAAIDKSVIDFDFWTQRGTSAVNFPTTKVTPNTSLEELQSLVGTMFQDQAFVSTGAAKGTGFFTRNIILNIYCPKGTKAAYVPSISSFSSENELILQRGYSYKVTKVEKKNGKIYMDCDLQLGSDINKFNDEELEQIKNKYFI